MPKYLVLWEVDTARVPVDPKERVAAWSVMINMIKQDMAEGTITDWGSFAGGMKGCSVVVQSEVELGKNLQRYIPFVNFEVHQMSSVGQTEEVIKALSG